MLATIEKRCRVGNDVVSLCKVCEASIQICKDCGNDEALILTIKTLTTRRSRKSKAIATIVEKAMPWAIISLDADGSPVVAPNSSKLIET